MHSFSTTTSLHWGTQGGHRDTGIEQSHTHKRGYSVWLCQKLTNPLLKDWRITECILMIIITLNRICCNDAKEENWQKKQNNNKCVYVIISVVIWLNDMVNNEQNTLLNKLSTGHLLTKHCSTPCCLFLHTVLLIFIYKAVIKRFCSCSAGKSSKYTCSESDGSSQ